MQYAGSGNYQMSVNFSNPKRHILCTKVKPEFTTGLQGAMQLATIGNLIISKSESIFSHTVCEEQLSCIYELCGDDYSLI